MKSSAQKVFYETNLIINSYLGEMEELLDRCLDQNCEVKSDINYHALLRDFNYLRGLWILARSAGADLEQLAFFQRDMKRVNIYLQQHRPLS